MPRQIRLTLPPSCQTFMYCDMDWGLAREVLLVRVPSTVTSKYVWLARLGPRSRCLDAYAQNVTYATWSPDPAPCWRRVLCDILYVFISCTFHCDDTAGSNPEDFTTIILKTLQQCRQTFGETLCTLLMDHNFHWRWRGTPVSDLEIADEIVGFFHPTSLLYLLVDHCQMQS